MTATIAIPPWVHLGFLLAKRLIMTEWITKDSPELEDWQSEMKLLYLEKLNAELNGDMMTAMFMKRWKTFIETVLPQGEINTKMHTFQFTALYARADLTNSLSCLKLPIQVTTASVPEPNLSGNSTEDATDTPTPWN